MLLTDGDEQRKAPRFLCKVDSVAGFYWNRGLGRSVRGGDSPKPRGHESMTETRCSGEVRGGEPTVSRSFNSRSLDPQGLSTRSAKSGVRTSRWLAAHRLVFRKEGNHEANVQGGVHSFQSGRGSGLSGVLACRVVLQKPASGVGLSEARVSNSINRGGLIRAAGSLGRSESCSVIPTP